MLIDGNGYGDDNGEGKVVGISGRSSPTVDGRGRGSLCTRRTHRHKEIR